MSSRYVSTLCISGLGLFHAHEHAKGGVHAFIMKQDIDVSEVQHDDR
jgi:hypothetical protein